MVERIGAEQMHAVASRTEDAWRGDGPDCEGEAEEEQRDAAGTRPLHVRMIHSPS
jgi:hypothetical protein